MKKVVIKYYDFLFGDEEKDEEVPYANKLFMFIFSNVLLLVVITLIVLDIMENVSGNLD